ncbi:Gfo/Idh/MocA family oxidoreductase [Hyphomicrobiales bacterium]|nr:Gfo/Idh/MocA family oxidoreductase [Hyphomicrobiales bacterium]CAH1701267.1 Gfo/Idh/MocA family oxidoreductase [Hyphomicrobiales bacterium]CAI0345230.1 Gfo/Idh/MocA family oxidoreductase [Hyphomicrobiales bacterium]
MPQTPISFGLIGAGIMGERMLRAALDQPETALRVSGIWDPSAAAMERIGAVLPAVPRQPDAAALIATSDCVYIASPPSSHLAHARAALAAGKAVFCEKPLAVGVEDARAFVGEAGERGAVNFPFASSPAVARLQEWIASGAVGAPQHVAIEVAFANWPRSWQVDAAGWLDGPAQGGFTREVVSHFLFLTRRIAGPFAGLSAKASFPEAGKSERRIEAMLTAGALPVTLSGSVGTTTKDDHNVWTLEGDKGAVRLCDWSRAERRLPDSRWEPDPAALSQNEARPLALRRQLEGVARLTRGEPHHLATLREAFDVQDIVETILKSA